ncbi:hypothetical protein E0H26_19670 [Micromonospora zingiberis]|uniref:Uncharacterized protein n=1 Tax=Micromonospora zingiberis TaxID=2053011 RepID=A0A4V2LW73_9ACTN|nr:hypothetical protein E0H26_19670 [Micromonospora zingiberis]
MSGAGGGQWPAGLTPEQRRRRARIAAHVSWANTADRAARTAAGTRAMCSIGAQSFTFMTFLQ